MPSTPRLPERTRAKIVPDDDFTVSEVAADVAGALSPFGRELDFPLPVERLRYRHPGPDARPHLAGGH
jgi:succinate dehydrogenase / fumarate reductase iron-sulfur subunit